MANVSKLTDEMRSKIEEVAALDGSVEEMAYYCDVSRQTIYNWLDEDKKLFDRVERLRERPILKARQTVVKRLDESYQNAVDYLKRKKKGEFGDNATYKIELPQPILQNVFSDNSDKENSETKEED